MQKKSRQRRLAPEFWDPENAEELARKTSAATNAALKGQTNNQITVFLEPDKTATVVIFDQCRSDISVNLTPGSASASAATGVWVDPQTGSATIHHDSSPATDRKFFAVFVG